MKKEYLKRYLCVSERLDYRQRASKYIQHIHTSARTYTCTWIRTHTRPRMKIAYIKMVFRGGWLMLRELEPPRYDLASWLGFVFFSLSSFVLQYLISLTLGYNRPAVVHAENEILMTPVSDVHRSASRCAQRKSCVDEKEIAIFAHIFIKYDWFLLARSRGLKYVFSNITSFNFSIVRNVWNDRIQYAAYRFIKIPLHTPKNAFLTVPAIVQSRASPTNDTPLIDKKCGFFFRQSIFIPAKPGSGKYRTPSVAKKIITTIWKTTFPPPSGRYARFRDNPWRGKAILARSPFPFSPRESESILPADRAATRLHDNKPNRHSTPSAGDTGKIGEGANESLSSHFSSHRFHINKYCPMIDRASLRSRAGHYINWPDTVVGSEGPHFLFMSYAR